MKKFNAYISESTKDENKRIQKVFRKLMKEDVIEKESKLEDFETKFAEIIHDEYQEDADPAHVIAGYAKRKFELSDLLTLMELLQETLADKSVDVRAYYGVNLGRLEVIIDRMIKSRKGIRTDK